MARHANKIQNEQPTEEPVVKENSTEEIAEETAEQTPEPVAESTAQETTKEPQVVKEEQVKEEVSSKKEEVTKPDKKTVVVICEKLYIRPEPNKKADLGVLVKGTKLFVNEGAGKLPEGWLSVTTAQKPYITGYVMAEYVK